MKKVLYFAAIAAMFAACSSEELANTEIQKDAQQSINFDVYTSRAITRAGLPGNNGTNYGVTTASLKTGVHKDGFGVFGYYTNDSEYDTQNSTPNFMYNQQVTWNDTKKAWTYEPVKYWPNEFGNAAVSDDIDRLTFFAYAPWTAVEVSTGVPPVTASGTPEQDQQLNIIGLSKNSATGDPVVKYVVDTKPTTSVDLLWGVAAAKSGDDLSAIDALEGGDGEATGTQYQGIDGSTTIAAGAPFVDLTKEKFSATGKVAWNFKHALSRLNVQIVAIVDQETEAAHSADPLTDINIGTKGDGTVDKATKVYVRSIQIGGFVMKGALNLHSDDAVTAVADAEPNWKDIDGVSDLTWEGAVTFFDGLKDGKEGTSNNVQKNEKPTGLNPVLLEEYVDPSTATAPETPWTVKATGIPTDALVNLFDGAANATDPIYVIPNGDPVDIKIVYDVQTQDENLTGVLSDGVSHGSAIENKIEKQAVFASLEPGKAYVIKIYVGLTSVKFEAVVMPWDESTAAENVDLPKNE